MLQTGNVFLEMGKRICSNMVACKGFQRVGSFPVFPIGYFYFVLLVWPH